MPDVVYVCRKCSYTRTVKEGQIIPAQVPTHCNQIMTGETESFKDGLLSGWHYYRECSDGSRKHSMALEVMTPIRLIEYARYILSIKVYSVVPKEWMNGFQTGWDIAKEIEEAQTK